MGHRSCHCNLQMHHENRERNNSTNLRYKQLQQQETQSSSQSESMSSCGDPQIGRSKRVWFNRASCSSHAKSTASHNFKTSLIAFLWPSAWERSSSTAQQQALSLEDDEATSRARSSSCLLRSSSSRVLFCSSSALASNACKVFDRSSHWRISSSYLPRTFSSALRLRALRRFASASGSGGLDPAASAEEEGSSWLRRRFWRR